MVLCLSRSDASSTVPPKADWYAKGFVQETPLLSISTSSCTCQHMCTIAVVHDSSEELHIGADLLNDILPLLLLHFAALLVRCVTA